MPGKRALVSARPAEALRQTALPRSANTSSCRVTRRGDEMMAPPKLDAIHHEPYGVSLSRSTSSISQRWYCRVAGPQPRNPILGGARRAPLVKNRIRSRSPRRALLATKPAAAYGCWHPTFRAGPSPAPAPAVSRRSRRGPARHLVLKYFQRQLAPSRASFK